MYFYKIKKLFITQRKKLRIKRTKINRNNKLTEDNEEKEKRKSLASG